IEEKAVTFEDKFYCPGKEYYVQGYAKPIGCHKLSGHGTVTFAEGLQQSCNPTLMQVAAKLGKQLFYRYFNAFGYSEKCGIDLPGEAPSLYTDYSSFNQVELATYSFGQTFKVTPIQHLTAVCAVANGGYLVTPYVVDKIVDDSGSVIKSTETKIRRQVVSPDVCRQVSTVLEEGVSGDGGAKNTYVAGYKIAAKTGTSQVRDILDEYGNSYLVVGSTVAYAPSDDPVVAVLIVVDAPQCASYYGSYVAAPYVANVMQEILPILGVERVYSDDESSLITVGVSDYRGWQVKDVQSSLEEKGLECEVIGEGNVVNDQVPSAGAIVSVSTGKIILYTEKEKPDDYKITVPDCVGETASSANSYLTAKGFNVKVDGATNKANLVVTAQDPEAGTELPRGSVITITVRYTGGTE
ncbi:MAG: PASTA domain-containing protein, partial [Clostridia bacterium]|nr:PASTA domain-containing protein [Clostridia bacterium]